jgi:glycerate kinase
VQADRFNHGRKLTRFAVKIKRQTGIKNPWEKKSGAAGGLAAPLKVGHVFMDMTSGRKQETGKTGSVIRKIGDTP